MSNDILSVGELKKLLHSDRQVRIVDVSFDIFDSDSGFHTHEDRHIPGAVYAHLDNDLSSPQIKGVTGRHPLPDVLKFNAFLGSIGLKSDNHVVVYDQGHSGFAARMWWLLKWIGHENVSVLDGGMKAWLNSGGTTRSGLETFAQSVYHGSPDNNMAVDREDLVGAVDTVIVDSRDEPRYLGIEEPIDPVKGHIPKAINYPWKANLTKDGAWKDKMELRNRFENLEGEVVFYCGSGVTACHNILAYKASGKGMAKLYPGSWSHWITDPDAKIVIGS